MLYLDVAIGLVLIYLLLSLFATNLGEVVAQLAGLRGRNLRKGVTELLGGSEKLTQQFYEHPHILALSTRRGNTSYLPPQTFADVVLELAIGPGGASLGAARRGDALAGFAWRGRKEAPQDKAALDGEFLARKRIASVLTQISDVAGDDAARLRAATAKWFDDAMERVSGAYRRRMQFVLLAIGFIVAAATDADTLRIAKADPEVVEALVQSATQKAPQLSDVGAALGWTAAAWGELVQRADWTDWIAKLVGLLLTAIAISLGAPFWFNALQKLLQIRSSLRPSDAKPAANLAIAEASASPAAPSTAVPPVATPPIDPLRVFAPDSIAYTAGNAWTFAIASQAAYRNIDEFTKSLPGTWTTHRVASSTTDTLCYVASSDRAVVVAFRGTESIADALVDVMASLSSAETNATTDPDIPITSGTTDPSLTYMPRSAGRTHHGFQTALDSVWSELEKQLRTELTTGEPRTIHFCGHSLGGALALLAAERWSRAAKRRGVLCVYTYGQPRCGDEAFVAQLEQRMGDRVFRHVNHRDAVPRLPPRALEYRHTSRCLYFDAHARLHDSPSVWLQVLDAVPIPAEAKLDQLRETVADHAALEYVRLTRAQLA